MSARAKHAGPPYQGFDSHVHVTVTAKQELKIRKLAQRAGLSLSAYMRGVIDELK